VEGSLQLHVVPEPAAFLPAAVSIAGLLGWLGRRRAGHGLIWLAAVDSVGVLAARRRRWRSSRWPALVSSRPWGPSAGPRGLLTCGQGW